MSIQPREKPVQVPRKTRKPDEIFGLLKRPGQPVLTIDEINKSAAAGWAGER